MIRADIFPDPCSYNFTRLNLPDFPATVAPANPAAATTVHVQTPSLTPSVVHPAAPLLGESPVASLNPPDRATSFGMGAALLSYFGHADPVITTLGFMFLGYSIYKMSPLQTLRNVLIFLREKREMAGVQEFLERQEAVIENPETVRERIAQMALNHPDQADSIVDELMIAPLRAEALNKKAIAERQVSTNITKITNDLSVLIKNLNIIDPTLNLEVNLNNGDSSRDRLNALLQVINAVKATVNNHSTLKKSVKDNANTALGNIATSLNETLALLEKLETLNNNINVSLGDLKQSILGLITSTVQELSAERAEQALATLASTSNQVIEPTQNLNDALGRLNEGITELVKQTQLQLAAQTEVQNALLTTNSPGAPT